uniref:Seizure related 6 homolog n=1 Tax=Anas platyrhynchos TaxID=8839 RepID=A0A8B9TTL9_ANAPL
MRHRCAVRGSCLGWHRGEVWVCGAGWVCGAALIHGAASVRGATSVFGAVLVPGAASIRGAALIQGASARGVSSFHGASPARGAPHPHLPPPLSPPPGFNGLQGKAGESSEAEGDPTALPTPAEREAEARFVSTAPTLKLLNHHPLLEDLLHEAFLKKDYLAQAPFPPALPGPILPADALRPAPGPPAPRSPPRAPALPRAAFPTAPLTTPAERPGPWGEPWGVTPGADPSPSPTVGSGSSPAAPSKVPTTPGTSLGGTGVSGDEEGTTTTSTITTTTVTTLQGPAPCNRTLAGPEGWLVSPEPAGAPYDSSLDCTYTISVYPGYGVEIKVHNISLAEGETLTVESAAGLEPAVLANESFLLRGQVIRSPANLLTLRFQSPQPASPGSYRFHYQAYLLSCPFPSRPAFGDVSVSSLHPGGDARFRCAAGYQLQGARLLTCRNATRPFWSAREPQCMAACGGAIRNATVGRVVSPGFPGNYSNNLTCHWLLEAPAGHRLHLHFEKVSLAEDDDRLIIRNGNNVEAPPVYDSYEVEYLPIEGLLSTGRHFFVELTTDSSGAAAGMALRYEAFEQGHCYEPFVKYGNFTASDPRYPVGTTVEFSCDPGYTLEQGSTIIECVDPSDPQWNETEPACRAVCSGELTGRGRRGAVTQLAGGVRQGPGLHLGAARGGGQARHAGRPRAAAGCRGRAHLLRRGRPDGAHPGPVHGRPRPLQALRLQRRCHHPVPVRPRRRRLRLPAGLRHPLLRGAAQRHVPRAARHRQRLEDGLAARAAARHRRHLPLLPRLRAGRHRPPHVPLGPDVERRPPLLRAGHHLPGPRGRRAQPQGGLQPQIPGGGHRALRLRQGLRAGGRRAPHLPRPRLGGPQMERPPAQVHPGGCTSPATTPACPRAGGRAPERRLYPAGATLRFSCASGRALLGEGSLRCLPGHPSRWSGSPPICKAASYDEFYSNRNLDAVAKAVPSGPALEGTNVAIAVFLPVLVVALLIAGVYLYFSKLQGKPALQLPLSGSHPYDHITVESAFDNPTYETGETREYEVSI